jgi:regulator of sigma E protease
MLVTALVFLLIIGVLVFVHELGHFLAARRSGVEVHEFAFGFRPRIFGKKVGETTYALNLIPLGGYVRMLGENTDETGPRSFRTKTIGQRFFILVAGSTMNLLLGWVVLSVLFAIGFAPLFPGVGGNPFVTTRPTVTVNSISDNSPAASAGLVPGDTVVAIDGHRLGGDQEFVAAVRAQNGQAFTLTIARAGTNQDVVITPRVNPPAGQGALGVVIQGEGQVRTVWYKAPLAGLYETGRIIGMSVTGFVSFVRDLLIHQQVSEDVTGLVGVGAATGIVRRLGVTYLLQLVALVSVGLGVVNLMPIMPLDGGHIAALGYEKLKGKPLGERQLGWLASMGLAFVLLVFLVVTYKDVIRFDVIGRIF